ncbi:hypothetical protein V8C37DRAFT_412285 [Trichoderma ceciliae]
MPDVLCCSSIKPYRPRRLDHEHKFDQFMQWAKSASPARSDGSLLISDAKYAVQLVKQVNYGPQESIRYFTPASNGVEFLEITESHLLGANFEKLNSYKNFKCDAHDRFFEVNLYQKSPTNAHHWRANLARPSTDIDLAFRQKETVSTTNKAAITVNPSVGTGATEQGDLPANPDAGASSSKLSSPPLQDHEANIAALKSVLRFLLPKVGANLGPSPLVSGSGLGLEIEHLWESELTSSNIATFLHDCSRWSVGNSAKLAEVESLNKVLGETRLREIVNGALDLGGASNWVSKCREDTARMFTAGPDEQLLKSCQRRDGELQETCSELSTEDYDEGIYYANSYRFGAYGPDRDDEDFTACDKECGYCGSCDY